MTNRPPPLTRCQLDRRARRVELMLRWLLGLLCGLHQLDSLPDLGRAPANPRGWRRLLAWLWLWCAGEHNIKVRLQALARTIAMIVVARANLGAPRPTRAPIQRPCGLAPGLSRRRSDAGILRALFGAHLRRRLRGRGLIAHLQALFLALRDLDRLVERMRKRLRRRLTRFRAIVAVRPPHLPCCALACPAPLPADSS